MITLAGCPGWGFWGGNPPAKKRLEKGDDNHTKSSVSKFFFLYTCAQKYRVHRVNGFSNVTLLFFILLYHAIKNNWLFFERPFEPVLALFVKEKRVHYRVQYKK
ncbi:hypothetical protein K9X07_002970 [Salmonella enterica]|nr:hypothetical protein [Salmonella enterica]